MNTESKEKEVRVTSRIMRRPLLAALSLSLVVALTPSFVWADEKPIFEDTSIPNIPKTPSLIVVNPEKLSYPTLVELCGDACLSEVDRDDSEDRADHSEMEVDPVKVAEYERQLEWDFARLNDHDVLEEALRKFYESSYPTHSIN